MSRIQFRDAPGFRYLELDFTDLDDTATVLRLCDEARAVIGGEPRDSVFTLTKVAGSRFNPEIVDALRRMVAADRPYYSGKHKRHGMNVQVLADPLGRLMWASPALPGAAHDLTAARTHGIIAALTGAGIRVWADKGYQGAGGTVTVPYRGCWHNLGPGKQAVNRSHAKIRAVGEQANAALKTWRLLRKLRCSPSRTTALVQAILALHLQTAH